MSNLVNHARRELELINEEPWITDGIVKVVEAFSEMGHSGSSADITIQILEDLLRFRNLSPLTDDPNEWINVSDKTGEELWQNNRNSEAFSTDGGLTYYLLSEVNRGWNNKVFHLSQHKEKK